MSRVLIIGYGPLPKRGLKVYSGAALRTRQILSGVLGGKHEAHLYTLPIHGTEDGASSRPEVLDDEWNGFKYSRFSGHSGEFAVSHLNEVVARTSPDAIIGVSTYASYVASMLATPLPLWCDLNAPWMAQMQAKCHAEDDDRHLLSAWNIEKAVLRRLDKFSSVSRPHLHAVIGELASVGRLNKYTFNYFFGSPISNSFYNWDDLLTEEEKRGEEKFLRGKEIPHGSFVILFSGGFKPSADVETLMQGLTRLMDRYDEVHFVATGGPTSSSESHTYEKFQKAVAASAHKDRFHMLGWVESQQLPLIFRESDLGINVDAAGYETLFAGRTRINVMAASGLPFLTTIGTEISEWIEDAHAALITQIQDPASMLEAVEAWIDQREKLKDYSRRATKMLNTDFTDAITTRPLRSWLEKPANAPDNKEKIARGGAETGYLPSIALNPIEEALIQADAAPAPRAEAPRHPAEATRSRQPILGKIKGLFGS